MPIHRNTGSWLYKGFRFLLFISLLSPLGCASARAQSTQSKDRSISERKVVSRIEPDYPETLKRLYIGGVVRIEITVDPSGRVASTELLGGSPILGQSGIKAVKQWKYAPAPGTEKLVVQLEFDPHR